MVKFGTAGQATDDNIIRRMRFGCWITKVAYTGSKCVTLTDFPLQQWLHQSASMLRYRTLPLLFTKQCSLFLLKFLS